MLQYIAAKLRRPRPRRRCWAFAYNAYAIIWPRK